MTIALGGGYAYCQNASAIKLQISIDHQTCYVGEPITAVCEIRNVSNSTIWLPPLQIVDVHFSLYRDGIQVMPFEFPSMPLYPFDELHYIELSPGQTHIFKRILSKVTFNMPADPGEYKLCMNYKNNKKSVSNIDLWVGKIDSCVVLKVKRGRAAITD